MDHSSMSEYMAHGYCLLWEPRLVWLHVISAILIGLAYFSIPISMLYFLIKRRDFPFTHIGVVFTLIFFSCGITHFFTAYIIYSPVYWLEGYVMAATAVISIAGAIMFIPMIPKALALPSLNKTLEALQQSEARMRRFYESGLVGVIYWNMDGDITDANDKFLDMVGYTRQEMISGSMDWVRMTPPEYRHLDERSIAELKATGVNKIPFEKEYIRKDGTRIPVIVSGATLDEARFNGVAFVLDITERKQAEELHGRLAAIVESADDAIISKDLNGIIQTWNAGAEKIFGYKAEEIIGKPISLVVPPGHADEVPGILARIKQGEHIENFETVRMRKDGTIIPVSLTYSPIKDARGRIIGASEIAHDITQRKTAEKVIVQLNQDLSARNAELVAEKRELEAFSYSVAHDLRAPIRHMSSYIELLNKHLGSHAGEKAKHYMTVIAEASKKMGMLIDDLLSFFRMGREETKKTTVNIADLVRDVIKEMAPDIAKRDVEWKIGALPQVYGDTNMLKLVIVNLISNAIKFTIPRSKAEIEIGCTEEDTEFTFYVKDNGVGFDMEYVNKLFGVFHRLHKGDEFEGTGIGLANVQRIISRHGGRVWAEGAVGQGAVFYFTIPKIKEI